MVYDFLQVSTRTTKQGVLEIYPTFRITRSKDLMIRGGDFYAIWLDDEQRWSTDEQDAIDRIDKALDIYKNDKFSALESGVRVLHLWDADTCMIDKWHKYVQRQCRDSFHMLDEVLIFANTKTSKEDYASKRLLYDLAEGDISAYDKLMSTLYLPEERRKIEWAIGSIVTGDSKKLQKFMVLYGAMGTGKSTVIHIIEQLFEGYISVFDAKTLGSSSNAFALEAFTKNPLVAIQHDGDLSHIEDNTRINSLVSHESMTVNEKFKSAYTNRFKSFIFMGTNKPVKITDARSGLIRRLIDVQPSGNVLPKAEYDICVERVKFELGAIAWHCREVYLKNKDLFDDYIPTSMLGASNDFYNFVLENYYIFKKEDSTTQKAAWEMYKTYCDEAKVAYPLSLMKFKEELKNYFYEFHERFTLEDGTRVRSMYRLFREDKFGLENCPKKEEQKPESWLRFDCERSLFDDIFADAPAQYADVNEKPVINWSNVKTKLRDIDTSKVHYVQIQSLGENYLVVDFDIKGEDGEKLLEKNLEAASKFPPTYAELSKSGKGIHLIYIYDGDPDKLARLYAEDIELKFYTGNSSLRRKLTKCNDIPINHISGGLPLKGVKMVDFKGFEDEKHLRSLIMKNLRKEILPSTTESVNLIKQDLEKAYDSGMHYDVSDLRGKIISFAAGSSHQAEACLKKVSDMKFKSEEGSEAIESDEKPIIFFDTEVFPNLFLVNWKIEGKDKPVVRMINPKPTGIENLLKNRLVGFNCRRYDNHLLYACLLGCSNIELYELSQRIISGDKLYFFGEAYNLSYTDVYDFSAKKQSLKKFEIELGIHHQELGLPWDKPVPEDMWEKVAEYCDNDVIATEAVFNARYADFIARRVLADLAGMTVNDTTNSLTTRIIFGTNRKPQSSFNYRDMGDMTVPHDDWTITEDMIFHKGYDEYTVFDNKGRPLFPGYSYESGKSTYRGEEVGEGGYVYAEPGMYWDVALLDIASMHPSSIIAEQLFGEIYTKNFADIRDARIAIKHRDFDKARTMLGGKLAKYLDDESKAGDLAQALKIAINSVYGLTSAGFENPFRDIRNKDNIVAKRGALFMVNLKHEVQKRGFTVAHIKTDSIKIPNATPEIIQFVMDYGKMYGYNFEHEATYDRMCLVNDAVYVAKYKDGKHAGEWTATGTQFAVPYVFKTLFTHEPIEFEDKCETKSASTALYLDLNENLPEGEHERIFVGKVGSFCPIMEMSGGGLLVREGKDKDGNVKYDAVSGTKGFRWLEAEKVREAGIEDDIDISYYEGLVLDAVKTISQYGDIGIFLSDKRNSFTSINDDELPF